MGPARGDAHRLGPRDLTVERLGYRSETAANLPQDSDFPGGALELIEQPGRKQRKQRGSACVQQHAELARLEVDIAGNVGEPLLAKTSLALHGLHFRLALPFV